LVRRRRRKNDDDDDEEHKKKKMTSWCSLLVVRSEMRMLMTRFINCSSRWAAFEFFALDQRLGKRG